MAMGAFAHTKDGRKSYSTAPPKPHRKQQKSIWFVKRGRKKNFSSTCCLETVNGRQATEDAVQTRKGSYVGIRIVKETVKKNSCSNALTQVVAKPSF